MGILRWLWEDHRKAILGVVVLTWVVLIGLTYLAVSKKHSAKAGAQASPVQTLQVGGLPVT